jgi:acyl-CoA thioesterase
VTRFDHDTAVIALRDGAYEGRIDPGWWVARGPNGGYVAAIILRAMTAEVADESRAARSLTVHYTAPPDEGLVRITTRIERAGRSLSTVSARMEQDGRLMALALAAFSRSRIAPAFADALAPDVPPPEAIEPYWPGPPAPVITERYSCRYAIGPQPFAAGAASDVAETGGWLQLAEPQIVDPIVVAAYMDAWIPAIFIRAGGMIPVPTIDLTVHFRATLPLPNAAPDDAYLVRFRSTTAADGFMEEDGELWSPDGVLVAQSRQLAAMLAPG